MSEICSICSKKYGSGIFSTAVKLTPIQNEALRELGFNEDVCQECAVTKFTSERVKHQLFVKENNSCYLSLKDKIIKSMKMSIEPIVNAVEIGFVTGYSTLGTGIFTEITSSITDA